jgi:probable rRNA maturation factor
VSVVEEGRKSASARGLARWLAGAAPGSARGEVSVAIIPDVRVRLLNRKYRGIDEATDVLSFPAGLAPGGRETSFLGDIVIARGIVQKQARMYGHSAQLELRVLALHGLLHLLGYDHEGDTGQMARIEARLRRKGGLSKGLIARSAGATRPR